MTYLKKHSILLSLFGIPHAVIALKRAVVVDICTTLCSIFSMDPTMDLK